MVISFHFIVIIVNLVIFVLAIVILLCQYYKLYKFHYTYTIDPTDMKKCRELYEQTFMDKKFMHCYNENIRAELSKLSAFKSNFIIISESDELRKKESLYRRLSYILFIFILFIFLTYVFFHWNITGGMLFTLLYASAFVVVIMWVKCYCLASLHITNIALAMASTATILKCIGRSRIPTIRYYFIHRVFDYQIHKRYILIRGCFTSPQARGFSKELELKDLNYKGIRVDRLFSKDDESLFLQRLDELKEKVNH